MLAGTLTTLQQFVSALREWEPEERESFLSAPYILISADTKPDVFDGPTTRVVVAPADPAIPGGDQYLVRLVRGSLTSSSGRLSLGRSSVCDVVLPFSNVSKVHAYLHRVMAEGCEIEDAGSTNGTRVDGKALAAGKRAALRDKTPLNFGSLTAVFRSARSFEKEFLPRDTPKR